MRRLTALCLSLLVCGSLLGMTVAKPAQTDDFTKFWNKFRTAVIQGNRQAVAGMARFPVGMSYGVASIKNRAEFLRRYREVFNQQADAARCFASAQPVKDSADPTLYTVACPDAAGNEVVIYHFKKTRMGWKFTALDNINE